MLEGDGKFYKHINVKDGTYKIENIGRLPFEMGMASITKIKENMYYILDNAGNIFIFNRKSQSIKKVFCIENIIRYIVIMMK